MSLWLDWSKNWEKGYKEQEEFEKQLKKAESDSGIDVTKLAKRFEELEALTPTEEPEVIAAAADLGLSDREYIDIHKQTKNRDILYNNNRSIGVDTKAKQSYSYAANLQARLIGKAFENLGTATRDGAKRALDKFGSYVFGSLRIFADSVIQSVDRGARNYSVEYQAALEEELNKQGKTLSDAVEIAGYEGLKDNKLPFIPGIKAHLRAIVNYEKQRNQKLRNGSKYYTPSQTATNFLKARGLVDEEGNPIVTKTDLNIFTETFPDIVSEKITALRNEKGRDLDFSEKVGLYLQTVDELIDPETDQKGLRDIIALHPEFDEQQQLNEKFFGQAIPVGLGDAIVFGLTGNLSTNYGYGNIFTESIDTAFDKLEQQAQDALESKQISGAQYMDILETAEQERKDALQDLGYEKQKSVAGFMAGLINAAKYIFLDPLNYLVPGGGVIRRAPKDFDEVLTSTAGKLIDEIDAGKTMRDVYDENIEVFQGISNLLVDAKKADVPIALKLINEGFHPDFAFRIKNAATTEADIIKTLEDGIESGFLVDMFYGGNFIGKGKNKHLQSKTLYENNLEALVQTELDEGITAAYRRGGGFRDTFLARDVKLPKLGEADLSDTKAATEYFVRYGYASKVPESRLEVLTKEFYEALTEGEYFQAKEIFENKLVFGEMGLQLKNTYGLTNNEIDEFFTQFYMRNSKNGFNDDFAKPMSPTRNPDHYDPMETDIITEKIFGSTGLPEQDIVNLTSQSIELLGQLKNLTIHGPDIQELLRATSAKRRLRAQTLNKDGEQELFDIVRKAADEGVQIDFWKEGSAFREAIDDVYTDFEDANILFKGFEKGTQTYDNLVFGYMRNYRYPSFLLGRLSYPLKLITDATVKFKLFNVRTFLDNPFEYLKLMLSDSEGLLARIFNYTPPTTLVGPYRTTVPVEKLGPIPLNKILPESLRKSLGVLSDSQQFGVPELGQLFSADVKFINNRHVTNTGHELVNKTAQGKTWNDAYEYYLFKYVDDDLAPVIAGMKRKGFTVEQIAEEIQTNPALAKIIDTSNKMIKLRGPRQRNQGIGIVKSSEDFQRLARHYSQSIDNYTGGKAELLNIIADAKIGPFNLRDLSSTTPDVARKVTQRLQRLSEKFRNDLPTSIPYPKNRLRTIDPDATVKQKIFESYRNVIQSIFFATTQGEGSAIRIPFIKQAYENFVKAFTVFGTKDSLSEMLRIHNDPDSVINLSDDIVEEVTNQISKANITLEDSAEVLSKNIKPQVTQRTDRGVTTFNATVFTEQGGNRSVNYLSKNTLNQDSLKLTTDLQRAEELVYKTADKIAEGRLGFDDSKIGTYTAQFRKDEVIYNGQLPDKKQLSSVLKNNFDSGYNDSDIDILINEALDYLSKPGATKKGLEDILGLSNKQPNLTKIKSKFQASTKGRSTPNKYSGELTFDEGRQTIERVLGKKITVAVKKQNITDELIDDIYKFTQQNNEGFSLDLGNPDSWGKEAMLFVSPYKTRTLTITGKDKLTRDAVAMFVKDNQDKLRLVDHVLGGKWDATRGQWTLDVSVKINRGVKDTRDIAGVAAYNKAKYLGLAADQISFGETYLVKEGDEIIETVFKQDDTYELINNSAVYNLLRTKGKKLLNDKQVKALGDESIVRGKNYLANRQGKNIEERAFKPDAIFEKSFIKGIFDRKNKSLEIFTPRKNTIMQNFDEYSYTTHLDLNDVKLNVKRNMSFEDIHNRAMEAAMEAQTNLLYNLTERGYFAQAYRSSFAFFEAYREYVGRYFLLTANNPKGAVQIGQGARRGIENNVIVEDRFGDLYVFLPTSGTPLEPYTKSDANGQANEDVSVDENRVYIKRGVPLKSIGVGGVGYLPSLGDGITIPLGFLVRNNPGARKFIEKNIMAGFALPFSEEPLSLNEIPAELFDMAIPSVAKNWFNAMSSSFGLEGVDEDIWVSANTTALQIAAQLHPELADDVDSLQKVAEQVRDNIYHLRAWDRFISPFAPKLNVMYKIEGNEQNFNEWYDKEGYEAGLAYNNFVELAAIQGFYQDKRKEWVSILGPKQGEYYALLEVVRLLGLDRYDINKQLTSAGLQLRGKSVSEAGRLPRTTKEYDFVNKNQELNEDFGPVLVYFSRNLDEGKLDFSGFTAVKYLGLITPKNGDELYLEVQRYIASLVQQAAKDVNLQSLEATGKATPENIKAKNAQIDGQVATWFPMAFGKSEQYNKVLGGETTERLRNDILVDYLVRASNDPRFQEFEITPFLKEYIDYRQIAIDSIQKELNYPNEISAINWLVTSDSDRAQDVRMKLYDKAYTIVEKYPLFMVVFDEVLSYELNRFGVD